MVKKIIEIDVDELKAIGGLQNLSKALDKVDESAKDVNATFEQVYGDLQPLTTRMGEAEDRMYELALAGKTTSQEYKDLLASVANYRKTQIETDRVVDASATRLDEKLGGALQGVTSSFAAVQGVMALTGGQSEDLEKAILKVQGAMALAEGVRGIREGANSFKALTQSVRNFAIVQKVVTAAQWLWNAAMAANPIGAIVATVVALIAAGVALTNYFMSNAKAAKVNAEAIEKNRIALENQNKALEKNSSAFDKKQKQELAMAKASGLSADAIRKLELKLIDEKIAYEKSQRAIAENTYQKNLNYLASLKAAGADEDLIKKQVEISNEAIKAYNKQNEDVRKSLDEKKDIQNRHLVEIKTSEVSSEKENAQRRKEVIEKAREDLKRAQEEEKAQKKKALEEEQKLKEDTAKKEIENEQKRQEAIENIRKTYKQKLEDLEDTTELEKATRQEERALKELENLNATEEQKIELQNFYTNLKNEAQKKDDDKRVADNKAVEDKITADKKAAEDARKNINSIAIQSAQGLVSILAGLGEKNKGIQRAALLANGSLSIAEIINNTNVGSSKEVATKGVLGLGTSAVLYAKMAISIGSVIAATAKGLKGLGGGSVAGGGTAGGGGTAPTQTTAPTFNVVGNAGVNQVEQTLGNRQPVQAYVVAGNVTTAQSLNRNIINNATLG